MPSDTAKAAQQWQRQIAHFDQDPMQGGLIDERTTPHRDGFTDVTDRSPVKPRRPALLEASLDAHVGAGHRFSFSVWLSLDTGECLCVV